MSKYSEELFNDEYATAALSANLYGYRAWACAGYLKRMDMERYMKKGKWMTADHLIQEAVAWAKKPSEDR